MRRQPSPWKPGAGPRAFHRAVMLRHRPPLRFRVIAAWLERLRSRRRGTPAASGREQPRVFVGSPRPRMGALAHETSVQINLGVTTRISQAWMLACHVTAVLPAILRLQHSMLRDAVQPYADRGAAPARVRGAIARPAKPALAPLAALNVRMPFARRPPSNERVAAAQPERAGAAAIVQRDNARLTRFVFLERALRVSLHGITHTAPAAIGAMLGKLRTTVAPWKVEAASALVHARDAHAVRKKQATARAMPSIASAGRSFDNRRQALASPALTMTVARHARITATDLDVTRASRVKTFTEAHVTRLRTLEHRVAASRTLRTGSFAFSEEARLLARARSTDWRFNEPSMAMRRAPPAQGGEAATRTIQHHVRQEELLKTVRKTVIEENERAVRQATLQMSSPQQIADDVYGMLTRRLVVERERLGR